MLKYRVKKIEDRQPKPEPENIVYKAIWGHEARPEEEGTFIAEWQEAAGVKVKQFKTTAGDIVERATYQTKWPVREKVQIFADENEN